MARASSRLVPGIGPCVGVGARVGRSVGVVLGVVATLVEFSDEEPSLISVAPQADAARAPIARMPTTRKERNLSIDNLYQPSATHDAWES